MKQAKLRYGKRKSYSGRPSSKPKAKRRKTSGQNKSKRGNFLVTQQKDYTVSVESKRIPKKKLQWQNFVSKVDKAVAYNDALCCLKEQLITPLSCTVINTATGQDLFTTDATNATKDLRIGAYGEDSWTLRRFLVELRNKQTSSYSGANVERDLAVQNDLRQQEIFIKGCSLNLVIKNTTAVAGGGYDGLNPEVVLVDIYECVSRDAIPDPLFATAYLAFKNCLGLTTGPNAANTGDVIDWSKMTEASSGVTPYQAPGFGKYWKILKKTRLNIEAEQKVMYTMNGYKGKVQFAEDMDVTTVAKGKVKDLIIIVNPIYGEGFSTNCIAAKLEYVKTYNFAWTNGPGHKVSYCGQYNY